MRPRSHLLVAGLSMMGVAGCLATTELTGLTGGTRSDPDIDNDADGSPIVVGGDADSTTRDARTSDTGAGAFDAGGKVVHCGAGGGGGSGSGSQCQYNANATCDDGDYTVLCTCPAATCTCARNGVVYATVGAVCPCPGFGQARSAAYEACGLVIE